jgi:fermentation-respiration switch protein FrsA (DUF1100 family)
LNIANECTINDGNKRREHSTRQHGSLEKQHRFFFRYGDDQFLAFSRNFFERSDFSLPIFVLQGTDDHVASFAEVQKYEGEIRAPLKALVPISGGHFACFTNSREFVEALRSHLLPLANDAASK